ncbi:hypothetical protein Taro_053789 [Colocasia esculenta]|uniref:Uncharacterized protein n=1 Tax=Colocasia esculenta TaxID=4460 RepID=A0A843XNL6_COLES|nr:hypothetical protein [Colocasia esculenta]
MLNLESSYSGWCLSRRAQFGVVVLQDNMCRQLGGGCRQIEASRTRFAGLGQYLSTAMGWLSTATAVPAVHSSVKVKSVDRVEEEVRNLLDL